MSENQYIVVLVTCSGTEESEKIAQKLVEENLAACVNIIPEIKSVYLWKNDICKDEECLLIIKSTESNFKSLEEKIKETHSYEVPEIISLKITDGNKEYLNWISSVVNSQGE